MGIDTVCFEAILLALQKTHDRTNLLTLARQQFHRDNNIINSLLLKYNYKNLLNKYNYLDYCETFFKDIGFTTIDSIDCNNYEEATIIHNLNYPVSNTTKKYNFIYDGGTIEHIYNAPQVCENIINLLEIGGIFCSITCNNNFSGHGFYQYSPEFFISSFQPKYGMKIEMLYLAQQDTDFHTWVNVNYLSDFIFGRNTTSFDTNKPVYIITVARKIFTERKSLLTNCPNQYSYKNINWV